MELLLTPAQDGLIQEAIKAGRVASPQEAARQAMSLWESEERKRAILIAELQKAESSLDDDEGIEISSDEELRDFFNNIKRRGKERLLAKQGF